MICPKCHSSFEYAIAIQVVKRRVYVDEHKGFVSYVNPDIEPGSAAEDFILTQFECPECGAVFDGLTEFRSKPTPEQLDKLKDDVFGKTPAYTSTETDTAPHHTNKTR